MVLENQVFLSVLEHQKGPLSPGQEQKEKSIKEVMQIVIDAGNVYFGNKRLLKKLAGFGFKWQVY